MIDRNQIGRKLPAYTVEVEKGRLRFFAKAIGETNPLFWDEQVAKDAGYRSLPAPPTFAFCLLQDVPNSFQVLEDLGADLKNILHGEQSFTFHKVICAGDKLTVERCISDIYAKKGGQLEFVVQESSMVNALGEVVAELRTVLIQRNV